MPQCAVWLGSFPDGAQRVAATDGHRRRRHLPPVPWMRDLLVQHGGPGFDRQVLHAVGHAGATAGADPEDPVLGRQGTRIDALLVLSSGECPYNAGPLTRWSREAQVQRDFYTYPLDDYELLISGVYVCARSPPHMHHKQIRSLGSGGLGRISCTHPLFRGHWGVGDGSSADDLQLRSLTGHLATARQVLTNLRLASLEAHELPVVLLPWPLAFLVTKGSWPRLLVLTRWHAGLHQHRQRRSAGSLEQWPPDDAETCTQVGQDAGPAGAIWHAEPLTPQSLQELSDLVRGWVPALLGGARPSPSTHDEPLTAVTRLDRWSFSWRQAMGMLSIEGGGTRFRHKSRKLLDSIHFSSMLTGGPAALVDALAQSLAIALPEDLLRSITPSPAIVRRCELSLDVALMLLSREEWGATRCIRVGWTDASPLAGYDWLWSQFHEIPSSELIRCHAAVTSLQQATSAYVAEHEQEQEQADEDAAQPGLSVTPLAEWVPWLQLLKTHVREHINPPTALGIGHRSLADKASSEVYKWQLQMPPTADLAVHSNSYIAHCSDMGVELGLPDFEVSGSVSALLPRWLTRCQPMDIEEDRQAHGDHDIDGPVLPAVPAEPEAPEVPGHVFLMPGAMPIAGFQHVVSNLCADIHQGMAHWLQFYAELKACEALLRIPERRQRFIWTCLRNSPFDSQARRFERFDASLYESRWHEVLRFLKCLQPLLPVLARACMGQRQVRSRGGRGWHHPACAGTR